jgi:hypothetical protein
MRKNPIGLTLKPELEEIMSRINPNCGIKNPDPFFHI